MKKVQENQKNQKKKNKGFTLVELIIVIAIIAILAIVLAPQYIKYVEKSRWSNDVNQMNTLESMVKTAIVEAQETDATANLAGTFTATKDGISGGATALQTALKGVDSNWSAYKLKNNGNHSSEAGNTTGTKSYTINVTSNTDGTWAVTGSWS